MVVVVTCGPGEVRWVVGEEFHIYAMMMVTLNRYISPLSNVIFANMWNNQSLERKRAKYETQNEVVTFQ